MAHAVPQYSVNLDEALPDLDLLGDTVFTLPRYKQLEGNCLPRAFHSERERDGGKVKISMVTELKQGKLLCQKKMGMILIEQETYITSQNRPGERYT